MAFHSTTSDPSKLIVKHLQDKIRRVEVSSRNDDGTIVSSGSQAMDKILPAGGYNRGTIIEWLTEDGSSANFLSLLGAKQAAKDGGAIVIVDPRNEFYPPAARALGIQLGNLIVLRSPTQSPPPSNQKTNSQNDFLWAIDQSLRCSAVAAVWGELPEFENPQIATRWLRRFQLSAESSGCCGMFIRKAKGKNNKKFQAKAFRHHLSERSIDAPSWAEIQWRIIPLPNNRFGESGSVGTQKSIRHMDSVISRTTGDSRLVRAELVRCRGGNPGQKIDLEINTITGNVLQARREHETGKQRPTYSLPLATQLARPANRRRTARA